MIEIKTLGYSIKDPHVAVSFLCKISESSLKVLKTLNKYSNR